MFHLPNHQSARIAAANRGVPQRARHWEPGDIHKRIPKPAGVRHFFHRRKVPEPADLLAAIPKPKAKPSAPAPSIQPSAPKHEPKAKPSAPIPSIQPSAPKQEESRKERTASEIKLEIISFHEKALESGMTLDLGKLLIYADAHFSEPPVHSGSPVMIARVPAKPGPALQGPRQAVEAPAPNPPEEKTRIDGKDYERQRSLFSKGRDACKCGKYSAAISHFEEALAVPGGLDQSVLGVHFGSAVLCDGLLRGDEGMVQKGIALLSHAFLTLPVDLEFTSTTKYCVVPAIHSLIWADRDSDALNLAAMWGAWKKAADKRAKPLTK